MKKIGAFIIISTLIIVSCNNQEEADNDKQSSTVISVENNIESDSTIPKVSIEESQLIQSILDTIWSIPEVIERNDYVINESENTRKLMAYIYSTPEEMEGDMYWVKVAEDNGSTYATHFNFFVYQNPYEIMYYETMSDEILSLNVWRDYNSIDLKMIWETIVLPLTNPKTIESENVIVFPLYGEWGHLMELEEEANNWIKKDFFDNYVILFTESLRRKIKENSFYDLELSVDSNGGIEIQYGIFYTELINNETIETDVTLKFKEIDGVWKLFSILGI